ncbi:CRISPR-associated protein Cas3 [Aggregatibacter actinomycetemcomitans serotype b str. SCC4092]|uniref:CRISPR-associated helicase/endonuclease Cas3 n=4 Tax=Aggregatibacter actinomycetemcomitans TaxID=714 RepID=UPI00022AC534|nr:CRISPR-associated helicase/endonuclease Cas3 [Aggregatibacter actinomycetemcomitans]KND83645.1 CRISPR-associated protein Cas3 [Aggregatibacter actinomycetemcomitans serotype b str. SCC1398]KOE52864.1 CRISPR-associated protein Cas3 [Aggregatibacter actinomycetemcomitans serotype b str. SCC4092]
MSEVIAHARQDSKWHFHPLQNHLKKVAKLARRFAGRYGALFAEYAGLLHDLGKFQEAFQEYIRRVTGFERENAHLEDIESSKPHKIPHSTAGAKYATQNLDPFLGHLLAYLIAGHHAGLADWYDKGSLKYRLAQADDELAESLAGLEKSGLVEDFLSLSGDALEEDLLNVWESGINLEELHIWMRFLFSCLVDADFLDTEAFMNGFVDADAAQQAGFRPNFPDLEDMHSRYEKHMLDLAEKSDKHSVLNQERSAILAQCFSAAESDRTLFSLTVPTGGGKTLASLGFALKHALKFGKKRIIYAIPFTSIIEQNADFFRKALGDDAVLEHHSNLEVKEDKETAKTRLAAENWDAPLIVTTNVQLFESLFAARTSRCRKIHNIADSVIILDEVQQLPRDFQKPITDMMRILACDYGVTFVLCTATQPELGKNIDAFGRTVLEGLPDVREIVADKIALSERLRRVRIKMPPPNDETQSWQEIADEIAERPCVLAVVNTRKHARRLFAALPSNGIKLHLSANMCATHRSEVIALVRRYLELYREGRLKKPLWVVSTQLIEAGVDLDFPCVYRAMAGLDSIAQAAGRCNREGKLPDLGEVIVFRAEQGAPSGSLKQGQDITEEMLKAGLLADPLSPLAFAEYFRRFNSKGDLDKHKITELLTAEFSNDNPLAIKFRTAAERFRLIDNQGVALIVPFIPLIHENGDKSPKIVQANELDDFFRRHLDGVVESDWQKTLDDYRYPSPPDNHFGQTDKPPLPEPFEMWFKLLEADPLKNKWVYRKLQRYTITVYETELKKLYKDAVFSRAGLLVLDNGHYHDVLGADFDDDTVVPPEESVL